MKLINPTEYKRLNEATGFVLLSCGLLVWLSLISYQASDPSWNTASGSARPLNLIGYPGAYLSDILYQLFGLGAFLFPVAALILGWKWIRSEAFEAPTAKVIGTLTFWLASCALLSFSPGWRFFGGTLIPGGVVGQTAADLLMASMNLTGALVATLTAMIVAVYLVSSFSVEKFGVWFARPIAWFRSVGARWSAWRVRRRDARLLRRVEKERLREEKRDERIRKRPRKTIADVPISEAPEVSGEPDIIAELEAAAPRRRAAQAPEVEDIPICALEDQRPPWDEPVPHAIALVTNQRAEHETLRQSYRLPPTSLLNEAQPRSDYDEQELKDVAARIKSKFEEFNVLGSVVQINPGPVVTTFEFKPEAGIKYSRIIALMEDLCLGLQAESILIERIPGKPTVGIEVPNTKREIIALRQILESDEFTSSPSKLTISMGKDISGRIKVASLETMPHALIAGSTGSGKSVMINSLIMSILYKSTPDEVRMIMVDPKRVELGVYEGIPHLLTPVITDPKKATYALKNAVLEMERRLRLLAEQGVRNIDQYNKKILKLQHEPRSLFEEDEDGVPPVEELKPLPYILILIDELADLMILEGRNVEESVTRLAQMARAVGMHLVLATQRPSVDVITGLIKANFPARMSFRVATRVDSRTILDIMGAEHLLGKGDMLFLPPGSSRLRRVHGAFVTESEINSVVEFWKEQAAPEYDQSFLVAPPTEEETAEGEGEPSDEQDPMYEEALRVILEVGKASTSTLQRRLRLGYGRAARILDMMHRDGIIGPPDGSKPREVLKRPDWLREPVG